MDSVCQSLVNLNIRQDIHVAIRYHVLRQTVKFLEQRFVAFSQQSFSFFDIVQVLRSLRVHVGPENMDDVTNTLIPEERVERVRKKAHIVRVRSAGRYLVLSKWTRSWEFNGVGLSCDGGSMLVCRQG